jgi:predicted nucleic acid-binding protein
MSYRLFIDSSVLFAAAYSTRGHAHDLIQMGIRGQVTLVISRLVLEETRRNLAASAPEGLPPLERLLENLSLEIVQPSLDEVLAATNYTALKDAPILAAARTANVDILVTLDQKHLLGKPELEAYARAIIRTPGETYREITEPK